MGLRWIETREFYGKEATEEMEISELENNKYYKVLAESHGAKYETVLNFAEEGGGTKMEMIFTSNPQGLIAKIMSFMMGPIMKKTMIKCLEDDLESIKKYCECT